MNVLFVLDTRLAKHGSFEDLLLALAQAIAARGGKSTFVFPDVGVAALGSALAAHARVHLARRSWRDPRVAQDLEAILSRERFDLVNTHFCEGLRYLPFYLAARARGARVIVHYHGEIRPLDEVHPLKRHLNALRLQTLPVHRIVTVSEANARFLHHLRVRPPVEVIYNGVDLRRFSPRPTPAGALKRYGLSPGARYLLYVGSLIPRKRIDHLLRTFALLGRRDPELRLVLVGGGELDRYQKEAHALGLADRVIFTGLTAEYPIDLLQHAQLLVSASLQESFGLLFAEALALGVPVVACRVGGVPEVVSDGEVGLLAEPHDLDDFTAKIARLLEDAPLRRAFATRARPWIERRFSLDAEVTRLLHCFAAELGHPAAADLAAAAT